LKLPHDVPGIELASLLRRHGYEITRQTGSHLRLTSMAKGIEHHMTIPRRGHLRVGTLNAILGGVASYLEMERAMLVRELSGR
jgi:predicted RNA binding protein YcfA (HicA-like mRNA interferase family)